MDENLEFVWLHNRRAFYGPAVDVREMKMLLSAKEPTGEPGKE